MFHSTTGSVLPSFRLSHVALGGWDCVHGYDPDGTFDQTTGVGSLRGGEI